VTILFDFLKFLVKNKKLWMVPVVAILLFLGTLLIAVKGSVVAPFIYTLF